MTAFQRGDSLSHLEKWTYHFAAILAACSAIAVLSYMAAFWHVRLIRAEHPQDYRETATYFSTLLLCHGQNPWALENQPQYANVYGVLYNLLALLPAKLFGCSFTLHRSLSAALLLLCCLIIFLVLRRYQTPLALALFAPILFYQQYMPTYQSNAKPDNLGLLLFLGAVLYPWYRRFSPISLAISGALAVLALYAKVYFAVALVYVAVYVFLFESRRAALLYVAGAGLAIGVSAALVARALPVFWNDVFFMQRNGTYTEWPFLVEQSAWYLRLNFGLLAILGFLLVGWAVRRVRRHPAGDAEPPRRFVRARALRGPLLPWRPDFVSFVLVFSTILIVVKVGSRPGNFGLYFHQLLTPFLLIVVFRSIATLRAPRALVIALPGAQLLCAFAQFSPLPEPPAREWPTWEALLSQYDGEVFVAPIFAHIAWRQGKTVYDDGQSEYVSWGLEDAPRRTARRIRARLEEFDRDIQQKVMRREFGVIIQWHTYYFHAVPEEFIAQYYVLAAQRPWHTAMNGGICDIWVPALDK